MRGAARSRRKRLAVVVAAMLPAGAALAQWSGSIGVESDYRFRGESLGGGRPTLRLSANYDGASGWYGGASATQLQLTQGDRYAQVLAYAGHVRRLGATASMEFGATQSLFAGEPRYNFAEAYAGLLLSSGSVRLAFSPDYFGRHVRTAYLDAEGYLPLAAHIRLLAHAGVLVPLSTMSSYAPPDANRSRADVRAGAAWNAGSLDLHLSWSAVSGGGPPPSSPQQRRRGWLLGATWFF